MRVLIFGQKPVEHHLKYIQDLFKILAKEKILPVVYQPYFELIRAYIDNGHKITTLSTSDELITEEIDFVITLGGDGTILSAVSLIQDKEIPILGINLGRLGFLASIEKKFINEAIRQLIGGKYNIESRSMLYLETPEEIFGQKKFALNDFTLHKRDTSSMITIHAYINGEFLNSYWADGIIVSTPTGSTGYSLSCGGPIIFPNSGNFVITAVAPHNLTVRPLVLSDTSVISFEIEGRSSNYLCTLDSRFETITSAHKLSIRKWDYKTKLVKLNNASFLRTINEKLAWGADSRN